MKPRLFTFGLIFIIAIIVTAGCNFPIYLDSIKQSQPEASSIKATEQEVTIVPALEENQTKTVAAPETQVTPIKSHKIRGGRYWCFDCISDALLKDFKVMGGVPPISFVHNVISVTIDEDGKVTTGSAHFNISTNIGSNSENCGTGDYEFDTDNGIGFYDIENHQITMDYTGEQSYAPMGNTQKCGSRVSGGTITLHYVFTVQENPPALYLCMPGETGDACLNNPMAILDN